MTREFEWPPRQCPRHGLWLQWSNWFAQPCLPPAIRDWVEDGDEFANGDWNAGIWFCPSIGCDFWFWPPEVANPKRCHYCGAWIASLGWIRGSGHEYPVEWRVQHREHLTPRSRGGTDDPSNIVLSCAECNARKGTKTYAEFVR